MAATQTALQPGTLGYFKAALATTGITKSLGSIMSEKQTARFKSTLTQIVTSNGELLQCSPKSVVGAGLKAATLGLDISPVFGYACIIPYKTKSGTTAQFQLMVNGWIQLAMRSGQYEWINSDAVYEDEYKGCEMLSGKVYIEPVDGGYRDQGRKDKIVGFYAAFRLLSGSEKVIYWTVRQIEIHARTYSKSYGKKHPLPIPKEWKGPDLYSTGIGWEVGWYAMAIKTMLKQLLRKWGPLSTEMQEALEADGTGFNDDGEEIIGEYDETGDENVLPDAQKTPVIASKPSEQEITPQNGENAPTAQETASLAKQASETDAQSEVEAMFLGGI